MWGFGVEMVVLVCESRIERVKKVKEKEARKRCGE